MAQADVDYVEPLSGEEIIIDLCEQIAEHLRRDCNLRPSDAYSGGYMARVSLHVEAYGMDTASVDAELTSGKAKDHPDELLDTVYEIPVEPSLNTVRERSDQPVPTLTEAADGTPVVKPRRYLRSAQKLKAAG